MSVYAPMLGTLWRTLESYGVEPREVIDEALFQPGEKSLSGERITFAKYDAALGRAVSLVKDPAFGIRSAQFIHPSHLGALGHAWMASSCLRTALRRAERFSRMFNEQVEIQVHELQDKVRVSYRMLQQPKHPYILSDGQLANLLTFCRLNFGSELAPIEVKLKRPMPAEATPWIKCFGPVVRFEQAENSLAISKRDADKALTGSNSELVAVNEELIQRHLLTHNRSNILNRTRLRIMEQLPSGRITEDGMANVLNMSKRTLHRKLRENDETFRSLLTQVRIDLAERYIGSYDYSITEIAFLLGYTDTSAFSRAFRNWFGRSPTQARERSKAA